MEVLLVGSGFIGLQYANSLFELNKKFVIVGNKNTSCGTFKNMW